MNKYRIVEYRNGLGQSVWRVQFRFLWLFWFNLRPAYFAGFGPPWEFFTVNEARDHLNAYVRQKKDNERHRVNNALYYGSSDNTKGRKSHDSLRNKR